jgi:hypothetical protein
VTAADAVLTARLTVPRSPLGIVLVLSSRGAAPLPPARQRLQCLPWTSPPSASSSRSSASPVPGDRFATALLDAGFAVLRAELRRPGPSRGRSIGVPDIAPLADRLVTLTRWTRGCEDVGNLAVGYFGTRGAAAVALRAAAELDGEVAAVVSSEGRPDLVRSCVTSVTAATLLIVGGADPVALDRNGGVEPLLRCPSALEIVPGATRRFAEPGAMDQVVDLSVAWFRRFLHGAQKAGHTTPR